jgi:hypothetical protein
MSSVSEFELGKITKHDKMAQLEARIAAQMIELEAQTKRAVEAEQKLLESKTQASPTTKPSSPKKMKNKSITSNEADGKASKPGSEDPNGGRKKKKPAPNTRVATTKTNKPGKPLAVELSDDEDDDDDCVEATVLGTRRGNPEASGKRKEDQNKNPRPTKKSKSKPAEPIVHIPSQNKILEHRVNEDGSIECHVVTFNGGKMWLSRERTYSMWFEEIELYVKDWNKTHTKKEQLGKNKGWKAALESRAKEVVEICRVVRDTTPEVNDQGIESMVDGQWVHCIYDNGFACWSKVAAVYEEYTTLFENFMNTKKMKWNEMKQEACSDK